MVPAFDKADHRCCKNGKKKDDEDLVCCKHPKMAFEPSPTCSAKETHGHGEELSRHPSGTSRMTLYSTSEIDRERQMVRSIDKGDDPSYEKSQQKEDEHFVSRKDPKRAVSGSTLRDTNMGAPSAIKDANSIELFDGDVLNRVSCSPSGRTQDGFSCRSPQLGANSLLHVTTGLKELGGRIHGDDSKEVVVLGSSEHTSSCVGPPAIPTNLVAHDAFYNYLFGPEARTFTASTDTCTSSVPLGYDSYGTGDRIIREDEKKSLNELLGMLWNSDTNRLIPNVDYIIGWGKGCKQLFLHMNELVHQIPTVSKMEDLLLYPDYAIGGKLRKSTAEVMMLENALMEAVYETSPGKILFKFLMMDGAVMNKEGFLDYMYNTWFARLRNKGMLSCGFRHTFAGEERNDTFSGLHDSTQFHLLAKNADMEYFAYRPAPSALDEDLIQLCDLNFIWRGIPKRSTIFIGVSPECQICMYTLLFHMKQTTTHAKLGPYHVFFKVFRYGKGGDRISSAFVELPDEKELKELERLMEEE